MEILIAAIRPLALLFLSFCCVMGAFMFESFALENSHLYWRHPRWKANALLGLGFVVHTVRESLAMLSYWLRTTIGRL